MGDKDNSKELFKEYEALVRFFHKKELKIKEAICFDKRVSYFRSNFLFSLFSSIEIIFYLGNILTLIFRWWFYEDDSRSSCWNSQDYEELGIRKIFEWRLRSKEIHFWVNIFDFFMYLMINSLLENKIIWKLERGQEEPKYKWPKKLMISKVIVHSSFL